MPRSQNRKKKQLARSKDQKFVWVKSVKCVYFIIGLGYHNPNNLIDEKTSKSHLLVKYLSWYGIVVFIPVEYHIQKLAESIPAYPTTVIRVRKITW